MTVPAPNLSFDLTFALIGVAAYLIGSIPTSYIVARQVMGIDIREHGSKNAGATNVGRVVGKGWGYFTLFLDVLKGLLPVLALRFFFPSETILHVLAALLLLLGHSKSIFLQFTGGKAAATGLGAVIAVVPVPGLICGALAFGLRFLTRYVSVGSIVAAALIAPVAYLYDRLLGQDTPIAYLVFVAVAGLLVIVRHKANIQRLMQGTENRI